MDLFTLFVTYEAYLLTEKRSSENTIKSYRRDLIQLGLFCQRNGIDAKDIKRESLVDFLSFLDGLSLSARSIARKIAAIKGFFAYVAEKHGWENPAKDLVMPRIKHALPHVLQQNDIDELFQQAAKDVTYIGKRNLMMLYTMYATGVRVSELIGLKISQVRREDDTLSVVGKGDKERAIPLTHMVAVLLYEYIEITRALFFKKHHAESEWLFPAFYNKKMQPISRQAFWGVIKKLWNKTGIQKKISPHVIRHSFATHMLKKGVNLRSLQHILGHEKLSTVHIYTHMDKSHLRAIYDKKHPRS